MSLRIRGPKGQTTLAGVSPGTRADVLASLLAEASGIPADCLEVLRGFPPRPVPVATCFAATTTAALGIEAGDLLTVRQAAGGPRQRDPAPEDATAGAVAGVGEGDGGGDRAGNGDGGGGGADRGGSGAGGRPSGAAGPASGGGRPRATAPSAGRSSPGMGGEPAPHGAGVSSPPPEGKRSRLGVPDAPATGGSRPEPTPPAPAPSLSGGGFAEHQAGMDDDEALARAIAASLEQEHSGPQGREGRGAGGSWTGALPGAGAASSSQASTAMPAAVVGTVAAPVTAAAPRAAPGASGAAPGPGGARTSPSVPPLRPGAASAGSEWSAVGDGTYVVRRQVADDNSCLFAALAYATGLGRALAGDLRRAAARAVEADPSRWDAATLGRPRAEYVRWISDPRSWGGAIELALLSEALGVRVAALDVQTGRADVYGGDDPARREAVFVLYDGIHYDALAVASSPDAPERLDRTRIGGQGGERGELAYAAVLAAAVELAAVRRAAHAFTDVASFTLRCSECGAGLRGEKEALEHAKRGGHTRFEEYK